MSEQDLMRIRDWVNGGAKLLIGSDHMGHRKIKVVRGPFGVWTRRFPCSEKDVERLRQMLAKPPPSAAA